MASEGQPLPAFASRAVLKHYAELLDLRAAVDVPAASTRIPPPYEQLRKVINYAANQVAHEISRSAAVLGDKGIDEHSCDVVAGSLNNAVARLVSAAQLYTTDRSQVFREEVLKVVRTVVNGAIGTIEQTAVRQIRDAAAEASGPTAAAGGGGGATAAPSEAQQKALASHRLRLQAAGMVQQACAALTQLPKSDAACVNRKIMRAANVARDSVADLSLSVDDSYRPPGSPEEYLPALPRSAADVVAATTGVQPGDFRRLSDEDPAQKEAASATSQEAAVAAAFANEDELLDGNWDEDYTWTSHQPSLGVFFCLTAIIKESKMLLKPCAVALNEVGRLIRTDRKPLMAWREEEFQRQKAAGGPAGTGGDADGQKAAKGKKKKGKAKGKGGKRKGKSNPKQSAKPQPKQAGEGAAGAEAPAEGEPAAAGAPAVAADEAQTAAAASAESQRQQAEEARLVMRRRNCWLDQIAAAIKSMDRSIVDLADIATEPERVADVYRLLCHHSGVLEELRRCMLQGPPVSEEAGAAAEAASLLEPMTAHMVRESIEKAIVRIRRVLLVAGGLAEPAAGLDFADEDVDST